VPRIRVVLISILLMLLLLLPSLISLNAVTNLKRGMEAIDKEDYELAIASLTSYIKHYPKHDAGYVCRAIAYTKMRKYDDAINDYTEAIKLNPQEDTYSSRGMVYADMNNYDKAIEDFSEAIKLDSNKPNVYLLRGGAFRDKHDYDNAIKDYTEAIRLDANSVNTILNRAGVYRAKEDYDNAIKDYTEAIRLDANAVDTILLRGITFKDKQDYDNAIKDYSQVMQVDPNAIDAYLLRGIAFKYKQEYDKAINDFSEATRLDPKDPRSFNKIAWIYATCPKGSLRDGKKAVEYATKACELSNWKDAENLGTLAAAHAECGNFKAAVSWQKKAMDLGSTRMAEIRLKLFQEGKPYKDE
jgi:tetratricopeptide (TPR) repeat protein